MAKMEAFTYMAAMLSVGLSAVLYLWRIALLRRQRVAVGVGASSEVAEARYSLWDPGRFAIMLAVSGLVFLTFSLVARWISTGHGPFSNMYEYNLVTAWGTVAAVLYAQWRYRTPLISAVVMPIAVALLIWAYTIPSRALPLVPALQQSLLLTIHVATAMTASGFFAVAFGAAVLNLIQRRSNLAWLPPVAVLDDLSYRGVIVGFPFWTLMIILGALWADIAWGRYWGWDPKETASLVTWFIYAGYAHARTVRGWKGAKGDVLLVIGFAAVTFTYLGNFFFTGLHAYT